MVVRTLAAGCTLLALAGCDADYLLHVSADVRSPKGPAAGAWIVPLDGEPFRTGPDGKATGIIGGLNRSVRGPIAVYAPGYRLAVVSPGDDFEMKPRGWFQVTEWDASLTATLEPPGAPSPMALSCSPAGDCKAKLGGTPDDFCVGTLLEADAAHATASALNWLPNVKGLGLGAGPGLDVTFTLPQSPARTATTDVFLVGECLPQQGHPAHRPRFFASDPVRVP